MTQKTFDSYPLSPQERQRSWKRTLQSPNSVSPAALRERKRESALVHADVHVCLSTPELELFSPIWFLARLVVQLGLAVGRDVGAVDGLSQQMSLLLAI